MRRVIKTSTTHIYILYARARAIKRYLKKNEKGVVVVQRRTSTLSLSLKRSKELFSRAFDISLCDDEMRGYVEMCERIFF